MKINQYECNEAILAHVEATRHGKNWPVVYILNNEQEVYIGESANFARRLKEHMADQKRSTLTQVQFIDDDRFNKSVVLDIESSLIRLMDADRTFTLQNIVLSQNQSHDYYQRSDYQKMIKVIWNKLVSMQLAKQDYTVLTNSNLFIYSPYKTLTSDQYEAANDILYELGTSLVKQKHAAMAVHGSAGTGKSILAVYLLKVLCDLSQLKILDEDLEELAKFNRYEMGVINGILQAFAAKKYKIGFVVPIKSFRKILKLVFKEVDGLQAKMLLTPSDVANAYVQGEKYDILLIDEAQRLRQPKNVQYLKAMYEKNEKLGLDKMSTELDWIMKCSDYQIFFYDHRQQVSGSDVPIDALNAIPYHAQFTLDTQMRVKGGDVYMRYLRAIFSDTPPVSKINLLDYEVKIFDDVQTMCEEIKNKEEVYRLCRNIAGFAWPWDTKNEKKHAAYDIEIDGHTFRWNRNNDGWIAQATSIDEIGSIHTVQGQDLNYAGLIIGEDISYDFEKKEIIIRKDKFFDKNAKRGKSDEEIKTYILNAYYILMSRAARGLYLYICDENFKKYMKQYF